MKRHADPAAEFYYITGSASRGASPDSRSFAHVDVPEPARWKIRSATPLALEWPGGTMIISAETPEDDMPWNTMNYPIVSEKFVSVVQSVVNKSVEFLPIASSVGRWSRKSAMSPVNQIEVIRPASQNYYILNCLATVSVNIDDLNIPIKSELQSAVPEGVMMCRNTTHLAALIVRHAIREMCDAEGVVGVQYFPIE